jgi:hypothetical protein
MSTMSAKFFMAIGPLVIIAVSVGCRTDGATRGELVGNYFYREAMLGSTHAPETLVINADGSFVQYYGATGDPKWDTNSGTWVLPNDARHRGDIYLNHLKRWEPNDPLPFAAGSVTNFKAGVEKSGNRVFIVLSDDAGQEFVKVPGKHGPE